MAVGDWRPDPKKFPANSLRELSDYVHAHGMVRRVACLLLPYSRESSLNLSLLCS
jgi:hypothetical protein